MLLNSQEKSYKGETHVAHVSKKASNYEREYWC